MMTEIQAVMELHLSKSLSHISVRKCVNLPTLVVNVDHRGTVYL